MLLTAWGQGQGESDSSSLLCEDDKKVLVRRNISMYANTGELQSCVHIGGFTWHGWHGLHHGSCTIAGHWVNWHSWKETTQITNDDWSFFPAT